MRSSKGLVAAAVVILFAFASGCGSALDALPGSGGGGDSKSGGDLTPTVAMGTLTGVVHDGVVSGADVNVYAWEGQKGELLASGTTDSRGRYSISLRARSQPVLIEATGGSYREETTGQVVSLQDGQSLSAVQNYLSGQALTTSLTYYTTLAAALAEHLARVGMAAPQSVQSANTRISDILGFDVGRTQPSDISGVNSSAAAAMSELEYGFATAGLSSLTEVASVQNNSSKHLVFNSIAFIQSAYRDLRFDGLLDGRDQNGALFFGRIPLTTDVYRHELALHILRAANSSGNQVGVPVEQLKRVARSLNDSTDPIFSGRPPIALDAETPSILNVTVDNGMVNDGLVLFGSQTLTASVITFAGASSTELLVNGVSQGFAVDPDQPSFQLDTRQANDGPFRLTLRVVDIAGAVGERNFDVMVSNRQTTIANISIREGAFLRGTQRVSAVINDPIGVSKIEYVVERQTPNGVLPMVVGAVTDPRLGFDFNTNVVRDSGQYSFVIAVTNNAGVTTRSVPIRITIDNVPPLVAFGATFRSGDGLDPDMREINQDIYNGRFRISASADDDQAPGTFAVFVDGVRLPEDPDGRIFDVDTTQFTDGLKTLIAIATDRAGNQSRAERQITFDNTAPRISITSPNSEAVLRGSFSVSYVVEEENYDQGTFAISRTDGIGTGPFVMAPVALGSTTRNVSPNEYGGSPGRLRLSVFVRDRAGNQSVANIFVTVR